MALDLKVLTQSVLNTLFSLGGDIVKDGSYIRPPSYAPATGAVAASEVIAAVKLIVAPAPARLGNAGRLVEGRVIPGGVPIEEQIVIRASELTAISAPAAGDYIVETLTGVRRDVVTAALDPTAQLWRFHTVRSVHQDHGDLTAHSASEDWGDLTSATEVEERGALYE